MIPLFAGRVEAEEVNYDSGGRRDPFISLASTSSGMLSGLAGVTQISQIEIEGLVYDPPNGSLLIANGVFLKQGQTEAKVKLLKVTPVGAHFLVNDLEGYKPLYEEKDSA